MPDWDPTYVDDLPDDAFLLVQSGGHKDRDGRTVPRTLRRFAVRNAVGEIDGPHLRSAVAEIPIAPHLSAAERETVLASARGLVPVERRAKAPDVDLPAEALGPQSRSYEMSLELRSDGGDGRTLLGIAVPYGVTGDVNGKFRERFIFGAFAKQVRSGQVHQVKVFESHAARLSGSAPIGKTTRLEEQPAGLHGEWPLFDTQRGNDALELVRSGEVTGLSVGFKPVPGGTRKAKDGVVERHVAHLDHVVLTHEPIYAEAGVLAVRSVRPLASYQVELDRARAVLLPH